MRAWTFHSCGSLLYGRDTVQQLGNVVQRFGGSKVFVATDAILQSLGIVDRVTAPLTDAGLNVHLFSGGEPEPSLKVIDSALSAAQSFQPDVILGLGGGSNMDMAKLVALGLRHGDVMRFVGDCKVPGLVVPLVCVPTTAGTGSEVSPAAVFTDTANSIKVSCLSPFLRPAVAVVDPMLTVGCPPKVTADSGIDALTHAIEAFTAIDNDDFAPPANEPSVYQGNNPLADTMAREAITLVSRFLKRAVADGNDLEARDGMALAATLGGLAFSNAGVALVHAMEYPVGGAVHVSHGAGNGLLLPYVMRYNLPKRVRRMARLAEFMGVNVSGTDAENADAAIAAVEQLRIDIGIPTRLRDLGVTHEMLPRFADKAFAIKRLMRTNPRTPSSAEELLTIYRNAF